MIFFEKKPTQWTPYILFDPGHGLLKIKGSSSFIDSVEFYKPVIEGLKNEAMQSRRLLVELKLESLSPPTVKSLFHIFKKIRELKDNGFSIKVTWYIESEDDDILETGLDFRELTEIDFEFHLY